MCGVELNGMPPAKSVLSMERWMQRCTSGSCRLLFCQLFNNQSTRKVTSCCKRAVYRIPLIREMMDAAPVDAIFFKPTDDIREDPFVLPDVLGYLGLPDPARWAVPNDLNRLLGIVKLARCLGVEEMLVHVAVSCRCQQSPRG